MGAVPLQLGVFIYELIVGHPPFAASGSASTAASECAKKILEGKLHFPPEVSKKAKDLITKLLHATPSKRLGAKQADFREIKGESPDLPTRTCVMRSARRLASATEGRHRPSAARL